MGSRDNIIQNKVRQLLAETELGGIASNAQIVIHVQDDAKQMLRELINQEYHKQEHGTTEVILEKIASQGTQAAFDAPQHFAPGTNLDMY